MINGERHHIKPRSLFPELAKSKDNIVKLTYREHYICHWLLTKIYPSKEMTNAFWLFHSLNKHKDYFNSHAYEESRSLWAKLNSDMHHLFGKRNGMYGKRGVNNPTYGRKYSNEIREGMSLAQIKAYQSPERHKIQSLAVSKGHETHRFTSDKYTRIKCVETGICYASIREVVRACDFNRAAFSKALKNNEPYKNLHFVIISKEKFNAETNKEVQSN